VITDLERRAAVAAVVVEIVNAVQAWRSDHPAHADGDTDYATLRIYAATDDTVPDPDDEAGQALAAAIAAIAHRSSAGLYGGAARVAFAVGHLSAGDDADLACEMIEASLLRYLEQPTESYDLISGVVGIAVPVLQRIADGRPSPSSEPVVRSILSHLERLSRSQPTGVAWHTPAHLLPQWQREIAPDGYINLGLAHGVPGVVAILARYIAAGVEVTRARRLLDGAVAYLLSVAEPTEGARYQSWLPGRGGVPRVAWCYGDLGVAVALLAAASATDRDDWRTSALELAHGMAARPIDASQVIDAGLCHGAAGVAHLFNRMAQATGDAVLARAADTWFDRTIAIRRSDPIAGYPRAMPSDDGALVWEPAADLLTGATGIALALHAAISPIEPAWDQLLLADLSPTT